MIRTLIIIALVALFAAGAAWIADRPGAVVIDWQGWEIRSSVAALAGAVSLLVLGAILVYRLGSIALRSPGMIAGAASRAREGAGARALARGLVAVAAGDGAAARRESAKTARLIGETPMALLLAAQSAQLDGNEKRAEAAFTRMLEDPETAFLGVRGLYMQAARRGDRAAALDFAARAVALKPKNSWAANALFELRCAEGDWKGAAQALDAARSAKLIEEGVYRRRKAVLLAAEALKAERDGDPGAAAEAAVAALKLQPSLAPAAAIAARQQAEEARSWKAAGTIEAAWAQAPHPALIEAYGALKPGESPRDRARRIAGLAELNPDHPESCLAEAEAWIAAEDYAKARAALSPLMRGFVTARACSLMAEIEAKDGDTGRAREWLARAARAPRDARWVCANCGHRDDVWAPLCPSCAGFDTYTWKAEGSQLVEHLPPLEPLEAAPGEGTESPADEAPDPVPEPPAAQPAPRPRLAAATDARTDEPPGAPRREPARDTAPASSDPPRPDDPGPDGDAFDTYGDEAGERRARW